MGEYFCSECKFFDDEVGILFFSWITCIQIVVSCFDESGVYTDFVQKRSLHTTQQMLSFQFSRRSLVLFLNLNQYALSTLRRQRSNNIIAINVESAEVEDEIIFSTVIDAAAAMPILCKKDTLALRSLCIKTALCAWR